MNDLISRQDAIDEIMGQPSELHYPSWYAEQIKELPSAQPERLTDDDFETIRIHLNAYKEKLCNQHRWKEAEEYQRIIDRFMGFASAQPEIIHCGDCKYQDENWRRVSVRWLPCMEVRTGSNWYCGSAERRTDE